MEYIVIIMKAPIVPLNSLILDIVFSIFAGLSKYQARYILFLQYLCHLVAIWSYKAKCNRHRKMV